MKRNNSLVAGLVATAMVLMILGGAVPALGLVNPVFGTVSSVRGVGSPRDIAVADFNEDGYDDVVAAVTDAGVEPVGVSLSLGGADPVLSAPVMISAGAPTWNVVATDLNADGHADVVASFAQWFGLSVLLGRGDGTFAEPMVYATSGVVRGVALLDTNADGQTDIVGMESELSGIVVMVNDAGSFSVNEYGVPESGNAVAVAVGQLAGDELPDLVIVDNVSSRAVVLGNSGGVFTAAQILVTGEQPRSVVVADFNSDGLDDIAASSSIDSDVEVFLANGPGGFADALVTSTGAGTMTGALAAPDLDVDGDIDLLVVNGSAGALVALENDGSGHMSIVESIPIGTGPTAIAVGDPNSDSVADAIVADLGDACLRIVASLQTVTPSATRITLPVPVPNTLATLEVAGPTRYETAIEASKLAFPNGTNHVVIASGENWPDAVTASALAGRLDAPLLLTTDAALPKAVADEVLRLGSADAVVIGGETAVSEEVAIALRALVGTGEVRRIAGLNRYDTADAVAREVIALAGDTFDGRAFVATGHVFADALAASPLAYAAGSPVYLTPPTGRSDLVDLMATAGVTDVVILGGEAALTTEVEAALATAFETTHVSRIAGSDRYETAAAVAGYGVSHDGLAWDGVGLATGTNFPDALAGGSMLGSRGSVMLLTSPDRLSVAAARVLGDHAAEVKTVVFLGSFNAIDLSTRTAAANSLR